MLSFSCISKYFKMSLKQVGIRLSPFLKKDFLSDYLFFLIVSLSQNSIKDRLQLF